MLSYSVFLFVAGFFRSPKAFLNLFAGTLKIISDYYPGRLHKAFVIDPPSLFSCLWKVCVVLLDDYESIDVVLGAL